MSVFSDAELTYLAKGKLGRLATIDASRDAARRSPRLALQP
jgi:hypothetical protein